MGCGIASHGITSRVTVCSTGPTSLIEVTVTCRLMSQASMRCLRESCTETEKHKNQLRTAHTHTSLPQGCHLRLRHGEFARLRWRRRICLSWRDARIDPHCTKSYRLDVEEAWQGYSRIKIGRACNQKRALVDGHAAYDTCVHCSLHVCMQRQSYTESNKRTSTCA